MDLKKIFIICFVLCSSLGFSQNKAEIDNEIISIANTVFERELKQRNRDRIYVSIVNPSDYFFKNIHLFEKDFKKNMELFNIIFNEDEIKYYKEQASEELRITNCDIETDSIFVYNKKRDFGIKFTESKKERAITHVNVVISKPMFTRDLKYAISHFSKLTGGGYVIYKKVNGRWKGIKVFMWGIY